MLIGKYLDHLPLYRLEQIAARDQVMLSRSTMAQWVGRIGVALQPLADRLAQLLLEHPVLHADETPVAQLDPGKGKTHRAYLWAYRNTTLQTGPPIVVFDYRTSRAGRHAKAFLADWRGHLMVDDFSGYKALFTNGVTELGCMAHARRKFFDLNAAQPNPIALEALNRIAALYAIEHQGKDMDVAARTQLRQAQPLLDSLQAWLRCARPLVANGSGTAKAMDYSLRRWVALSRYAGDGRLPIDNNPVENIIRPIAIGKNNVKSVLMRSRTNQSAGCPSVTAVGKGSPSSHNQSDCKNCMSALGGRYRTAFTSSGFRRARARSFILRSASTYM